MDRSPLPLSPPLLFIFNFYYPFASTLSPPLPPTLLIFVCDQFHSKYPDLPSYDKIRVVTVDPIFPLH